MARPRTELQEVLEDTLGTDLVYFQPPANVQLEYPCIVYKRDFAKSAYAGNLTYRFTKRYQVTYLDKDPDSAVVDALAVLPMCSYVRNFASDGVNHDVFNLFF